MRISVVVRSIDRGPFLQQALASLAVQEVDLEVLVVAAIPGHQALPERCGPHPLRLLTTEHPLARAEAANRGLDAARGDAVLLLDDDDWVLPHHLQMLAHALSCAPEAVAVYSDCQHVDAEGHPLPSGTGPAFDPVTLFSGNWMPIHTVLWRREVLAQGCRFDESLDLYEDWDFWLQLARLGPFRHCLAATAVYRVHTSSGVHAIKPFTDPAVRRIYRKWLPRWTDEQLSAVMQRSWQSPLLQAELRRFEALQHDAEQRYTPQQSELDRMKEHLLELEQRSDALSVELEEREARIRALLDSTSWRVTAPLRLASRLARQARLAMKPQPQTPGDAAPGLRVTCLVSNPTMALVEIRLGLPLERWARNHGGQLRMQALADLDPQVMDASDVIVLQRDANAYILNLLKDAKAHGRKVIFEIDDLLCDLPPFLAHHAANFHRTEFEACMRQADAVTVTTQRLSTALQDYGASTFVIPNCAETPVEQPARQEAVPADQVTLVIASTDRVHTDLIVPALRELQGRHGVRLIAIGPSGPVLQAAGLAVECHDKMPYAEFKALVAGLDNGIGVIPLDDSRFSSCKSAIKFLDYALGGVPAICSRVPPYSDVIDHGVNGLLCANTTEDWTAQLERLILDAPLRRQLAQGALELASSEYNLDVAASRWNELLTQLVPDLPQHRARFTLITTVGGRLSLSGLAHSMRLLGRPAAYRKGLQLLRHHGMRHVLRKFLRR